MSGFIKPGF